MKRTLLLIAMLLAVAAAHAQEPARKGPAMRFEQLSHNFGTMEQGSEERVYEFVFVNDGDAPLIITRCVTSCRCVTIQSPKRPIAPGTKGSIKVTFDPKDVGVFNKGIEVRSNIPGGKLTLLVGGEVTE